MKRQNFESELEQNLKTAFDEMAPDPFDSIKEKIHEQEASARPEQKDDNFADILLFNGKKGKNPARLFRTFAAAAAMICICLLPFLMMQNAAGTIYIDVNPSISIAYDKKGEVTSIQAENDDGENILNAFHITESSVSSAMGQIFDQLDQDGYFADQSFNMIVSNCSDKKGRTAVSEKDISRVIDSYIESKDLDATWVYQSFTENEELSETAGQHRLSVGKLYFLSHASDSQALDKEALEQENVTTIFKTLESDNISLSSDKYCTVRTRKKKHAKTNEDKTPVPAKSTLDTAEADTDSPDTEDAKPEDTDHEAVTGANPADAGSSGDADGEQISSTAETTAQSDQDSSPAAKEKDTPSVSVGKGSSSSAKKNTDSGSSSSAEKKADTDSSSVKESSEDSSSSDKKSSDSSSSSGKKKADAGSSSGKKKSGSSSSSAKKKTDSRSSSAKKKSGDSSSSAKKKSGDSSSSAKKKSGDSSSSAKKKADSGSSSSKKKSGGSSSSTKKKAGSGSSSAKKKSGSSSSSGKKKSGSSSSSGKKKSGE